MPHRTILCMPPRAAVRPMSHPIISELELTLREDAALSAVLEDLPGLMDRDPEMARRMAEVAQSLQRDIMRRRQRHMEQARKVLASSVALLLTCVSVLTAA